MERRIIFILTFIVVISSGFVKGSATYSGKTVAPVDSIVDLEFQQAWLEFSKAILSQDLELIKSLSSDCIWHRKHDNQSPYVSIDKFLVEDLDLTFNDRVKSRLLDKTKIKYNLDDSHNSKLYDTSCIIGELKTTQCEFKEVLLTYMEPAPGIGGGQWAFSFVKKNGKYKFCGFSTIP